MLQDSVITPYPEGCLVDEAWRQVLSRLLQVAFNSIAMRRSTERASKGF